nr:MAG TPA: Lysis protein [Caudoviricetes sp.]
MKRKLAALTATTLLLAGCGSPEQLTSTTDAIRGIRERVFDNSTAVSDSSIEGIMESVCDTLRAGKDNGLTFERSLDIGWEAVADLMPVTDYMIVVGYSARSTCPDLLDWIGDN